MEIFEDKKFNDISYAKEIIADNKYEYCVFSDCDFAESSFLSCSFINCKFIKCNFSMTKLSQSTFNDVEFEYSKILGVDFSQCNDFIFEVRFDTCILDYSSFEKRKMSKTIFRKTSLKGVDFANADLKQSSFIDCDMNETIFYYTNLQEADLSSAFNYTINPEENTIKKARFSKDGLIGLLQKYNIIIE